jgi:hypothetical protein
MAFIAYLTRFSLLFIGLYLGYKPDEYVMRLITRYRTGLYLVINLDFGIVFLVTNATYPMSRVAEARPNGDTYSQPRRMVRKG